MTWTAWNARSPRAERALSAFPRQAAGGLGAAHQALLARRCSAPPIAHELTLTAAVHTELAGGAADDVFVAQAGLALIAAQHIAWDEAGRPGTGCTSTSRRHDLGDCSRAQSCTSPRGASRSTKDSSRMQCGADARAPPAAHARPLALARRSGRARAHPRPSGARATAAARAVFSEAEGVLERRRTWALSSRRTFRARALGGGLDQLGAWTMSLTGAELGRNFIFLATRLVPEILARRLFISPVTSRTRG